MRDTKIYIQLNNMKTMGLGKAGILNMLFLLSIVASIQGVASAQDFTHIISNSEDWKDVYSIIHYANLEGVGSSFLVSPKHGSLLLNGLNRNNDIRVITSKKSPFVINYDDVIKNSGFKDADEVFVENANLELIEELPEISNFIVVGNTYGYNAIAVAPYAVLTDSWVFLADKTNIDEIDAILGSRDVENVMIYGFVDRDVREALSKYDPEIIDTGDRFKDNIEIMEKYLELNPVKQIVLSNGEFIESEIMSGREPVLFTGKENVPDQIRDYIKSSDIEVGVLVGADLVGAATNIRRSTGISVIVKFARGARAPGKAISAVEGLDLFYIPVPIMDLSLHSAKYNKATSQLELTYKSNSNIPIFFKGTITPVTGSEERTRIGDVEPVFIAPNDFKTIVYPDLDFTEEELSIELFTLYGDSPSSLEKILEKTVDVEMINVIDRCDISIENVVYSKPKESFVIEIENMGNVDCWADVELTEVIIDSDEMTIGSEGAVKIDSGKRKNILIEQEMTDSDLEDNSFVNLIAYYGEREDSLVKIFQGKFELRVKSISFATIGLVALAMVVLAAIVIFVVMFFRRDDDDW